jgi:protein ImuB
VALDRTLAELESLCGNGRVGAPEVANDHRPEAYTLKPFQPGRAAEPAPRLDSSPVAVRSLRPPVAAQVRVEQGRPAEIRSAVATGSVVQAAGPWRTTGHWWSREERFAVDHFDVQVSDGTVLRLCFDWIRRRWQVDAIYD